MMVVAFISCKQIDSAVKQKSGTTFHSGLKIENGINRGIGFTDSFGAKYNIRYIPISLFNDTSQFINLELSFSHQYPNPSASTDNGFKIVPLPSNWVRDGAEITDSLLVAFKENLDQPEMNITLSPGEERSIGIGTVYPQGLSYPSPLPYGLVVRGEQGQTYPCEYRLKQNNSISESELELQLVLYWSSLEEFCGIVDCGRLRYNKH